MHKCHSHNFSSDILFSEHILKHLIHVLQRFIFCSNPARKRKKNYLNRKLRDCNSECYSEHNFSSDILFSEHILKHLIHALQRFVFCSNPTRKRKKLSQ